MKKEFCCETMQYHAANHCDIHDDPFDCPDCLIYHDEKSRRFGIIIHDGGQSFIEITHCPWCGQALEKPKTTERKMARKHLATLRRTLTLRFFSHPL